MEKDWKQLTIEERQEARFERWLAGEGLDFASPEARASYQRKITRFKDVVQLRKTPDRVPVFPFHTFMPVTLFDVLPGEVMRDGEKLVSVWRRYLAEYKPDYYISPGLVLNHAPLEKLGYTLYRLPGKGVDEKYPYQCVEGEYMTADEYEALIEDPSDFFLRTYLPRICDALKPFQFFPPLTGLLELPCMGPSLISLGTPEIQSALQALMDAGKAAFEWGGHIGAFEKEAQEQGHVNGAGGISKAPFDALADTMRGTRAAMMDMYMRKDLLLKALERLTPIMIKLGISGPNISGNPIVFIPLHKGADGFMSDEQFKTFYWPFLKEVVLGLIEEGCIPFLFAEGGYNSRLEYLNELPKGRCVWMFDKTDMAKAKEVVGETTCIAGNVPITTILSGTPEQVKEICKGLIDVAGKGGGYIMASGCSMDEGKPETIHAMIDFTKEYGVYK